MCYLISESLWDPEDLAFESLSANLAENTVCIGKEDAHTSFPEVFVPLQEEDFEGRGIVEFYMQLGNPLQP